MAEQLICNQQVDGSTPFTSSSIYGGIPERPKGADCKSVVTDFAGPNPASPTITRNRPSGRFFVMWWKLHFRSRHLRSRKCCWFAYPKRRSKSSLFRRSEWVSSLKENIQFPYRPSGRFFIFRVAQRHGNRCTASAKHPHFSAE